MNSKPVLNPKSSRSPQRALTIEFVGLPGAGKTTSSRAFSALLQQKGFRVLILQDVKDYLRRLSLGRKLLLVAKAVLTRTPKLVSYTASLARNRIYSGNSIYRFIRLTLFDLALQQMKQEQKADIILLEQWMIQELWSATIFKGRPLNQLEKQLQKYYFKTDFVLYFDLDVATAARRIGWRKTNMSRFDRMEAERREEELMKYGAYLYELFQRSNCRQKHLYSARVAPEVNAASFMRQVEEQFSLSS
ncbi:hypothetical protein V9K67_03570 [Paraflavisolibacter sp. H34]|uniref:hypothetical protein n=1 Tax=Huijunlia imazamoxiresistens TaxID=3127457 RepID=UPI003019064A